MTRTFSICPTLYLEHGRAEIIEHIPSSLVVRFSGCLFRKRPYQDEQVHPLGYGAQTVLADLSDPHRRQCSISGFEN